MEKKETIDCKQCGGTMVRTVKVDRDWGMQIMGLMLALAALAMIVVTPLGSVFTFAGLAVLILAARLGYKRAKVWQCESCGYFFDRAG